MSSTNTVTTTTTISPTINEEDERLIEEFAMLASTTSIASVDNDDEEGTTAPGRRRRPSRASINFFQRETSKQIVAEPSRRNSFLGLDGKVQDEYIRKRASLNKPTTKALLDSIPALADLTQAESITRVDGNVLAQLFVSGYAKLGTKVDYLNKINVFPIADGDTGANMKVCLKLPSRNLVLDPSDSILRVASNMAADVLLNGQGNSGTILSHFYVSLAEEIRDFPANEESLSIDEFASCLAGTGRKMADAVPNPVEGTLLSVARDSCSKLWEQDDAEQPKYANLQELLDTWNDLAQSELQKTPNQLIVDGVKVLEKAGVVDSGAQGFVYTVEGMWLASKGELPEASDPKLFQTAVPETTDGDTVIDSIDDHNVCDTKYQYCTEAVVLLKDGVTKEDVMAVIDEENNSSSCGVGCACSSTSALGDSVVCVAGPAKEGGTMLKIHIHTNEPQRFFDKLQAFNREPILKKEKVEDMKIMREVEHGSSSTSTAVEDSKFVMIGLSAMCLPPTVKAANKDILFTFPMFMVPTDTNEPIDIRYVTDTEALIAQNKDRSPKTAVRFTTATSSPMQMKIELLAALSTGKPVLCFVFSINKKMSAFGRNVLQAIDMLDPDQKKMVHLFIHGWGHDGPFMMEAIRCAREGKTVEEAYTFCDDLAQRTYARVGFMNAEHFRKMKAWRPGLFPAGFEIPEGHFSLSGPPSAIRHEGTPVEKRTMMMLAPIGMGTSQKDAYEKAAKHIKSGLKPGQKVGGILLPCVGRPDYGHLLLQTMKEAGIEIVGTPHVYSEGIIGIVMGAWGTVNIMYNIVEEQ